MLERNFILFDDDCRDHLLPMTFTRPVAAMRIGILTIMEKWQRSLSGTVSYLTQPYLRARFPAKTGEFNVFINGCVLPDPRLVAQVSTLQQGEAIVDGDILIAAGYRHMPSEGESIPEWSASILKTNKSIGPVVPPRTIRKLTDIIQRNGEAIRDDYKLITYKRRSATVYESNRVMNRSDVFIEEGARVEFAFLNASKGPIYIGRYAEVMEGAMIRGPFGLGDHSEVKMGAKIYSPTSIGPYCKVGGEVSSSIIFGYSNKAHDGFLGHSVLGEWCNIGADSNNSNLKNDYGEVRLYDYATGRFEHTGMQFCGLVMGDHAKCGINTMFNTGTVVGVFANIFGGGYPRNYVPSFSWGSPNQGFTEYKIDKAIEVARIVMQRREMELSAADESILRHVHSLEFHSSILQSHS